MIQTVEKPVRPVPVKKVSKPPRRPTLSSTPKAEHATAKSGYAHQLHPGQVVNYTVPGTPIPAAALSGRQEGRLVAAERQYRPNTHKVVTLEEASQLMSARQRGTVPMIRGGLDDQTATKAASDINDPYPDAPESSGYDGMTPVPAGQEIGAQYRTQAPAVPAPRVEHAPQLAVPAGRAEQYLKQRRRITLELQDSTMSMSCIDVIVGRYAVTLLLPMSADGGTVVPKPGSALTIQDGDREYAVFYPGASFEVEALQMIGLSFIRSEES